MTSGHSQKQTKRSDRRTGLTTATVEHETSGLIVIHPLIVLAKVGTHARSICSLSTPGMTAPRMPWTISRTVSPINHPSMMMLLFNALLTKFQVFDSIHEIFIISFLSAYKLACDKNNVYKGVALGILHFVMECPSTTALNHHIALRSTLHMRDNDGTAMSYYEAMNYL